MSADSRLEIWLTAQNMTEKAFSEVTRGMDGMTRAGNLLKGSLAGIAAGISFSALVGGINAAVGAASDMEETISKVNTLFGPAEAAKLRKWGESAAESFGLSNQEALDAVGNMGNMFLQLGSGAERASELSRSMIQLSADIASFQNVSGGANEVLEAMQSSFRGEYDSLQKYIPIINAAAVEQQALADTGKKTAKELTALEKATAAYTLIINGAGAATGDWNRTIGSLANQQRILTKNLADVRAELGEAMLPAVNDVIKSINRLVADDNLMASMKAFGELVNEWLVSPMVDLAKVMAVASKNPSGMSAIEEQIEAVGRQIEAVQGKISQNEEDMGGWRASIMGAEVYREQLEKNNAELERLEQKLAYLNGQKAATGATPINPFGSYSPTAAPPAAGGGSKSKPASTWEDEVYGLEGLNWYQEEVDRRVAIATERVEQEEKLWEEIRQRDIQDAMAYDQSLIDGEQATNEAIIESKRQASEKIIQLSERTAWAMQENFSSLFLDIWRGEMDGFEDYFKRFFESLQQSMSDFLAQMTTDLLFGNSKTGQKSGLGLLGSLVSGLFGSIFGGGMASPSPTSFSGGMGAYYMAGGGVIGEPVLGIGLRSGSSYAFGEGGAQEVVLPMNKMGGGGVTINMSPNINVRAIDTQSGMEFLRKNGAGVAKALVEEMKHSYELSKILKAT